VRIVGGRWRGRRLVMAPGREHRPTQERVREALFDCLGVRIAGARVIDLYAGSGALGLEALSRGALHALFVEAARPALMALRANIEALAAGEAAEVVAGDALEFLARRRGRGREVDVLLADPPYGTIDDGWLARVATAPALHWAPQALLVLEGSRREPEPRILRGWRAGQGRLYGETRLVIHVRESADGERE